MMETPRCSFCIIVADDHLASKIAIRFTSVQDYAITLLSPTYTVQSDDTVGVITSLPGYSRKFVEYNGSFY